MFRYLQTRIEKTIKYYTFMLIYLIYYVT